MKEPRISVIMPVFLGAYQSAENKSAADPERKFIRAVRSFLMQTFTDAELIIVSDGCQRAVDLYIEHFLLEPQIHLVDIPKQELFSGAVRQKGLEMAKGEIICYLDHDDIIGPTHLWTINQHFILGQMDWIYYDDYLVTGMENEEITATERRINKPEEYYIGTSSIAHKRRMKVEWGDGYRHDWRMIRDCLIPTPGSKIPPAKYYVCHCTALNIDF